MDPADMRAAAEAIQSKLCGPGGPFELVEEDVLGSRMPVFKNRARSLGALLQQSLAFGDRDYLVTAEASLSFADHARRVASLADALREDYNVSPGDRVAIAAANSPEWITAFWAVASLGAIAVACNAWWSPAEFTYALAQTSPRVVIADTKLLPLVADSSAPIVSVESALPRLASRTPEAKLPSVPPDEDEPAVIMFTSGTSGK